MSLRYDAGTPGSRHATRSSRISPSCTSLTCLRPPCSLARSLLSVGARLVRLPLRLLAASSSSSPRREDLLVLRAWCGARLLWLVVVVGVMVALPTTVEELRSL